MVDVKSKIPSTPLTPPQKIYTTHGEDTAETRTTHGEDTAETRTTHGEDTAETRTTHGEKTVMITIVQKILHTPSNRKA